jgi:serine/threonine-protein kinase
MILAKLDHPNICKLMDFFPDGDNYAIVMEYIEGAELKELLSQQNRPLPFDQACHLAKQCLEAFQYAHKNGILHCDIKPGNIMIDQNGDAKIMDFGIASMSTIVSLDTTDSMLSVNYTSPERLDKSNPVDVRSDIYSLALVFYEMFAGRSAFSATDRSELIRCHRNEIPKPPDAIVRDLPKNVSRAISKGLEKNPKDRFQDFRMFRQAFEGGQKTDSDPKAIDDETSTIAPVTMQANRGQEEATGIPAFAYVILGLLVIIGSIGAYIMLTSTTP